jgi:hypothetical protein
MSNRTSGRHVPEDILHLPLTWQRFFTAFGQPSSAAVLHFLSFPSFLELNSASFCYSSVNLINVLIIKE